MKNLLKYQKSESFLFGINAFTALISELQENNNSTIQNIAYMLYCIQYVESYILHQK